MDIKGLSDEMMTILLHKWEIGFKLHEGDLQIRKKLECSHEPFFYSSPRLSDVGLNLTSFLQLISLP